MTYSYEIVPRPDHLGGGWRLRLLEDGQEVGGGVFPLPETTADDLRAWWTGLEEEGRAYWRGMVQSPDPVKAHRAYLLAEEHAAADAEACAWLDTRGA